MDSETQATPSLPLMEEAGVTITDVDTNISSYPTSPKSVFAVADKKDKKDRHEPMSQRSPPDGGGSSSDSPAREAERSSDTSQPPAFPQLSNNTPSSPILASKNMQSDGDDEEPATARGFQRSASPTSALHRNKGAIYQKVGEEGICKMHKFSLYETASRYYLVGGDIADKRYRILKIERTADSVELNVTEDDIVYTKKEMNQLLNAVDDGNKASGGLKLKCSTWGLLGFIRFTGAYYMLLITKRKQVAMIGGHYIYQVDGTELISLTVPSSSRFRLDRDAEETRFVGVLNNLDLSRSFYFSYSYDITRTLQHIILHECRSLRLDRANAPERHHNPMFVWNHHLLEPALKALRNSYDWCLPIIHGFVDQAKLSIYGRTVYLTIIARRSRFFAGARFLKRGANDLGYVANDVETEQIVSEMLTTSFHAPGPELFANPSYTSYVQHRGSIPLYWTQDNTGVTPKPDIEMNLIDPFYSAAALHFDNLFERYGAPIYVLNLVKARERTPRESILLKEYTNAIAYLNQFLPEDKKIKYKAWDMSRASKSRDQDVIGTLESIAGDVMATTSFFRNGASQSNMNMQLQSGVARTNCIDCLDRTNAAQFVIGKRALGHQLHALGIIHDTSVDYDTDAVNLFTHMYHDHGDTIAIQYGGSHLVNTMETYRKINQWSSHSRDMVESFKRYYNNSFLDRQRQEAYNLFLGNYIFVHGQPLLWDLATDYYLHHADPRAWSGKGRKNYTQWYKPENLKPLDLCERIQVLKPLAGKPLDYFDDYWTEYYRPLALSSLQKIFAYRMNSTFHNIPFKSTQEGKYDLSPFRIRASQEHESPEKGRSQKEVSNAETPHRMSESRSSDSPQVISPTKHTQLPTWLHSQLTESSPARDNTLKSGQSGLGQAAFENKESDEKPLKDKSAVTQWTLNQFVSSSLNPSVADREAHEYERYINHPQTLPLVTSTDISPNPNADFLLYVKSNSIDAVNSVRPNDDDVADYTEFLDIADDVLTVFDADTSKKRYKAYRQWLKGKSLFKQQRIDP